MKPVLLLIPGMLNDARVWADVAAGLVDMADVRVANVQVQTCVPDMAADAWALLHDVPAQVPVVLAGFSLGGYVAIEMLVRPLRPVRAAALLSTSAQPDSPEGAAGREKTIAAMQRGFDSVVDGIVKWGTHAPGEALTARLRQMMLDVGTDTAIRQTRAIMGRGDHREALAKLRLPVRVLCGRQDRITPPELSEELVRLVPAAQLQWVADSGHMLPCEQPQGVVDALRPLLA